MSEGRKGEVIFLDSGFKEKEEKMPGIPLPLIITYIVEKYFSGEKGQERLRKILTKKIADQDERDGILEFIDNLMMMSDTEEDLEIKAAQALEDKYGLIDILGSGAKPVKNKEQIVKEMNEELPEIAVALKSRDDEKLTTKRMSKLSN